MMQIPTGVLKSLLTAAIADDAVFDGCKIGLFQNDVTPTRDTVLADLTPANFNGYALSAAVTWGTPFINDDGVPQVLGDVKQFTATSGGTLNPQSIYGYFVVNGAGNLLLAAERFAEPSFVGAVGEAVAVVPYLTSANQVEEE